MKLTAKNQTKLHEACEGLSRLARQRGAGAKLPTVVQLRQSLGVGVNTLNEALAQMEGLNLITRRQGSGIFVSPHLPRTIALVCDPTIIHGTGISPVWEMILCHAHGRAETEGENLEFHMANPWTRREPFNSDLIRKLEDHHINGVIGIGLVKQAVEIIEKLQIPFVSYAGQGTHSISSESFGGLQRGYAELMDRGCRRIAIWNPASPGRPAPPSENHMNEFRVAVEACGGHFEPGLIWDGHRIMPSNTLSAQEQGFLAAKQIFTAPAKDRPDGLYICDDMMAHGVLIAFDQLDIKIGQNLILATHANRSSGILQGRTNLILLENDPALIVEALFDTVERLMDHLDVPVPKIEIPSKMRFT